jgi:hypothetical protein
VTTFQCFRKITYLLTPWSRVLLEKITGFAANQEIPRILWNPTLHIAGRSSIRNLRTRHAVVTGTHKHGFRKIVTENNNYIQDQIKSRLYSRILCSYYSIYFGSFLVGICFRRNAERKAYKTGQNTRRTETIVEMGK